ncbi:MAG: hypothetical protein RLZZ416_392 [Candidatus Parcubacteria bacterium]|jgi:hypothetical protein
MVFNTISLGKARPRYNHNVKRSSLFVLGAFIFAGATIAFAQEVGTISPGIPEGGTPITARVTCYAPGAGGNIEGPFATSRPDRDGRAIPHTLDDVRFGRSKYVTLAGNPANYGKWYNMGTISYISIVDNHQVTLQNVVGYVHDTGSAFREGTCARYSTCTDIYRKFDIAYGDFRRGGNVGLVNSMPFCANKNTAWKQVGGPVTTTVTTGPQVYVPPPPPSGSGYPQNFAPSYPQRASAPAGSPFANVTPTSQNYFATQGVPAQQGSAAQQLIDAIRNPATISSNLPVNYAAELVAQPPSITRGMSIHVSWSSVGMKTGDPCVLAQEGKALARKNSGSITISTTQATSRGTIHFVLGCVSQSGSAVRKTAAVVIK